METTKKMKQTLKFQPSAVIEIFFTSIAVIIVILSILIGLALGSYEILGIISLLFPILIISASAIISKVFRKYEISDNEIEDAYQFISKTKQNYRMDQITSISLYQSFFHKLFDVATIEFGIYGASALAQPANQTQGQNGQALSARKFLTIKNYKQVYEKLAEKLNIEDSKEIEIKKPSLKPTNFFKNLWGFLSLILIITPFILWSIAPGSDFFYLSVGISIFLGFLTIILYLVMLTQYYKVKSTNYNLTKNYVQREHNYFFSKLDHRISNKKITNTSHNKNIISYALFKVGSTSILTGGSNDMYLGDLEEFVEFSQLISKTYNNKSKSHLSNNLKSELKQNKISDIKIDTSIDEQKEEFMTKPEKSFFLTQFFWSSIVSIYIGAFLFAFNLIGYLVGLILVYLLLNITRLIVWKNTNYYFFPNKIIAKGGFINITTHEIYFKNIKHVELVIPYFFDRLTNVGTIKIYTAGTSGVDEVLNSVKLYKDLYAEIKQVTTDEIKKANSEK